MLLLRLLIRFRNTSDQMTKSPSYGIYDRVILQIIPDNIFKTSSVTVCYIFPMLTTWSAGFHTSPMSRAVAYKLVQTTGSIPLLRDLHFSLQKEGSTAHLNSS